MLEIIQAARDSLKPGLIDMPLYDKEIMEGLAQYGVTSQEGYHDLRLAEINSLERGIKHTFLGCNTWKNAVSKLTCKGWDENKVVHWFTTPIRDKPFPVKGASSELRIGITGGARFCKLGNHRLAAGKVWMMHNRPQNPTFRDVHYYYYPVEPTAVGLLNRGTSEKCKVSFSKNEHGKYILVEEDGRWEIHEFRGEYLLMDSGKSQIGLSLKKRKLEFKEIPVPLIHDLLNDTWPNI